MVTALRLAAKLSSWRTPGLVGYMQGLLSPLSAGGHTPFVPPAALTSASVVLSLPHAAVDLLR